MISSLVLGFESVLLFRIFSMLGVSLLNSKVDTDNSLESSYDVSFIVDASLDNG